MPDSAILPDQSGYIVLTVGSDDVVKPKPVQLGDLRGGLRVIRSGLDPTDRVIVEGVRPPAGRRSRQRPVRSSSAERPGPIHETRAFLHRSSAFRTVINIFIVLFGLAAMVLLPVAQYPNIVPPTIQIATYYPGASAETSPAPSRRRSNKPINGVENMDYITSQSTGNGHLTITVIFKIGTDPNTDLMLTQSRVQDTLSRLPEEVQAPGRAGQEDHPGPPARRACLFTGRIP